MNLDTHFLYVAQQDLIHFPFHFWVIWGLIDFELLLVFQVAEILFGVFDGDPCESGSTASLFWVSLAYV